MPRYVAFLRAINVGGRTVKMERLARIVEGAGMSEVQTFIASGNVLFSAASEDRADLERTLERALETELGFSVDTFVRTAAEVIGAVNAHPFSAAEVAAAGAFCVGFLHAPLDAATEARFLALSSDVDRFAVAGEDFYWLCRTKQSESLFSNAVFEKTTRVATTIRGMNTIARLVPRLA